jgi:hypothetical protein
MMILYVLAVATSMAGQPHGAVPPHRPPAVQLQSPGITFADPDSMSLNDLNAQWRDQQRSDEERAQRTRVRVSIAALAGLGLISLLVLAWRFRAVFIAGAARVFVVAQKHKNAAGETWSKAVESARGPRGTDG